MIVALMEDTTNSFIIHACIHPNTDNHHNHVELTADCGERHLLNQRLTSAVNTLKADFSNPKNGVPAGSFNFEINGNLWCVRWNIKFLLSLLGRSGVSFFIYDGRKINFLELLIYPCDEIPL